MPDEHRLNTGEKGDARHYAVAATFEPTQPGLREWAAQRLMSGVFAGLANDLVVPTEGVYDGNGSARFPIDETARLLFIHGEGVNHCGYFGRTELRAKLQEWLINP